MADARENLPSTPHRAYVAALPDVELIRDLMAGTRVVHEKRVLYLPKFPKEPDAKHKRRAEAAPVYGGLTRTISASVGLIFAKPPALDERLQDGGVLAGLWENIDLAGTDGSVFCKRVAEDAIADGFAAILVDAPPSDGTATQRDADALNLRPYWRRYQRLDILSWRIGTIANRIQPVQVVLREAAERDVGLYGSAVQVQYRVLRLVMVTDQATGLLRPVATWAVFTEERAGPSSTTTVRRLGGGFYVAADGAVLDFLPIALAYAGRTDAPFTAKPPLLDVANTNLYYYRKEATLSYNEELCGFPMIHSSGAIKDPKGVPVPLEFGPSTHFQTTADGTLKWVEVSGTGSEVLTRSLERQKRDMSELGLSFLAGDKRVTETAKAKQLDATAENATLSTAATGIEDAINQALVITARYLGLDEAPSVTLNRDFENIVMDAPTMLAYVTAVEKVGLSGRVLLEAWQRGGRIPEDADLDAMHVEMMAEMAAAADRAAVAAEATAGAGGAV